MNRLNQERVRCIGYQRNYDITNNFDEMKGDGIINFVRGIKDKIGNKIKGTVLRSRPKILKKLLESKGNQTIIALQVCRQPVSKNAERFLNFLTFGKMKKEMQKLGYDRLFHLWMILYLSDGSVYSLEKNERVNVVNGSKGGECTPKINYGKETLNKFILDAEEKNIDGFYQYSMFKNNCQKWIRDIMNANGITQFDNFIMQDVNNLAPKWVKHFANVVTDVAGAVDFTKRGGGYSSNIPTPEQMAEHQSRRWVGTRGI
jgi:hypothetical protein